MNRQSLKPVHKCYSFFACVQICALIAAAATTTKLALFIHHLAGFTLLLQGAAVVGVLIYLGGRRCLRPIKHKMSHATARGAAGLIGLVVYTGILAVYGRHLPGAAKELSVVAQLAGVVLALGASLYVVRLHEINRQLLRSKKEMHTQLSIKHLRHHFLFNALNTTVCLVNPQPEVAIRILVDLSALFRVMLQQKPIITINEETEFVRCYIRIERRRLGARLGVKWQLPDYKLMCTKMPSMIMQPLVENAIYHGIETYKQGGTIKITIKARGNRIFFDICNPVGNAASADRMEGNHMAQKIVHDRLFQVYGPACRYTHQQRHGEYRVAFSIPQGEHL